MICNRTTNLLQNPASTFLRVAVTGLLLSFSTGFTQAQDQAEDSSAEIAAEEKASLLEQAIDLSHAALFKDNCFPSAKECAACHPQHYREWSVSPHAYAQLSPVFNAMSNKLNALTAGTLGDFCIRCHTPVGMALSEPISGTNLDRHPASREGVTCITCDRINQTWGKGSGR